MHSFNENKSSITTYLALVDGLDERLTVLVAHQIAIYFLFTSIQQSCDNIKLTSATSRSSGMRRFCDVVAGNILINVDAQ